MKPGKTIWFTGLSASGKTTLADKLAEEYDSMVVRIEGEDIRKTIAKEYGYSKNDRELVVLKMYEVSKYLRYLGLTCIVCSVTAPDRVIDKDFFEVYLRCPVDVCKQRDYKDTYSQKNVMGVDIEYEKPLSPDVIIDTDKCSPKQGIFKILKVINE
jgi:adenylylsulfate kinase-like enzyme